MSSSLYPLAIPFKFFVISLANDVESTLASVLGYVTNFFSYKFWITSNVSSGFILNLFVHWFWISARLNNNGAFSFCFDFFSSVTLAFFPCKLNINFLASSSFLNPVSLYNCGELYIFDFSFTFHSALNCESEFPNIPTIL